MHQAIVCRIQSLVLFGEVWPPQIQVTGCVRHATIQEPLQIFIRTDRGIIAEGSVGARHPGVAAESEPDGRDFELAVPFRRDVLWRFQMILEASDGKRTHRWVYLPWTRLSLSSALSLMRIAMNALQRILSRYKPPARWEYRQIRAHKHADGNLREPARQAVVRPPEVKLIAFYLPQFHPIPENDAWWEPGFTEWSNVTRALPQFQGHYQPRLPADLGFYDLRLSLVMEQQVALARHFGLYGFCFHHFWFAGQRLLERPVNDFLGDSRLDFPFCLCWANENWSRRWDGSEQDVLMQQDYSPEHDANFIDDLLPYIRDDRYIKIDGHPLLIIYRVNEIPNMPQKRDNWRKRCRVHGVPELYLIAAQTFNMRQPLTYGIDSAVEFPPHFPTPPVRRSFFNTAFKGHVYDYESLAEVYLEHRPTSFELFKTLVPCWDNTPRKESDARIFDRCAPQKYSRWLEAACLDALKRHPVERRFVFINAWNEWAEGAYLEPDQRYGYAFLNATADVLDGLPCAQADSKRTVGSSVRTTAEQFPAPNGS